MSNEKKAGSDFLYTLIPLEKFKEILGIDDREDKIARFCLVTGTFAIEQYCKRRLLKKQHFEVIEFLGDLLLPLREYPVRKILAAFLINNEQVTMNNGEMIEPEFYRILPDCGTDIDIPFSIEFSPAIKRLRCKEIKIVYQAGYSTNEKRKMKNEEREKWGDVPADLSAACLELASWNMNRYRGRRIGVAGNLRGGKEGDNFEMSMPENVRELLEPYKRRVI